MPTSKLRKEIDKILVEWIYKWDNDKASTKEANDKLTALFRSQMKGILPEKRHGRRMCSDKKCVCEDYQFNFCLDEILEKLDELS